MIRTGRVTEIGHFLGAQRDSGGLSCGGQGSGAGQAACLCTRTFADLNGNPWRLIPAGADDEHHHVGEHADKQRRHSEFSGPAGRAKSFADALRMGCRDIPSPQGQY